MIEGRTLTIEHPGNVVEVGIFRTIIDAAANREIEVVSGCDQIPQSLEVVGSPNVVMADISDPIAGCLGNAEIVWSTLAAAIAV